MRSRLNARLVIIIILALVFIFLAYLEVRAGDNTASIKNSATTAKFDTFQIIDSGLEIICAEEVGGELKFVNHIPICGEKEHD